MKTKKIFSLLLLAALLFTEIPFDSSNAVSSRNAVYAQENNPYLTKVFFLLCDDTQREHGNKSKAQKIADICAEKNWETISMANDWKTIYGENVTINPQ